MLKNFFKSLINGSAATQAKRLEGSLIFALDAPAKKEYIKRNEADGLDFMRAYIFRRTS